MSGRDGKLQIKIETWTPAKARKQLELNRDNRPLSDNWVLRLAAAMESGEFLCNGETIKIATDGTLKDGQHRLHAIVASGVTVRILTVRNLPLDCFDTIDQGKRRQGGDLLARRGEKNANLLSAGCTWVWKYLHGQMSSNGIGSRPRTTQIPSILDAHPGLRDSVPFAREAGALLAGGITCSAHYLFSKSDQERSNRFFDQLCSGEGLTKTKGVYQFRERMIQNKGATAKLGPAYIYAMLIKAFNVDLLDDKVKCLKWGAAEEFPRIKGFPEAG